MGRLLQFSKAEEQSRFHMNLQADITNLEGGLRWAADSMPGIHRVVKKSGFSYVDSKGRVIRNKVVLERIRRLAIPPAYTDVWISPSPHGHLQATGRDARQRKQYRYHADWLVQRSETKFSSLPRFGRGLAAIRDRVKRDLSGGQTPTRTRVLAAIVHLLDTTWVRIGNDTYQQQNGSFGLTTLQNRHSRIVGAELRLSFMGKSGVQQSVAMSDQRVARIVRRCRELPGQRLFQYVDELGEVGCITSSDVNAWLLETSGEAITAKDFRTWHASVLALQMLTSYRIEPAEKKQPTKPQPSPWLTIIASVAARLGNTPTVCRKSYIHPSVGEQAESLSSEEALAALHAMRWLKTPARVRGLDLAERQFLSLLASRSKRASK